MQKRLTIFGEPLAYWAEDMLKAALSTNTNTGDSLSHTKVYVLTYPQIHQLFLPVKPHRLWSVMIPEEELEYTLHAGIARATLVHSQRLRRLDVNRGDTPVVVDITATALSARGVALTNDESTLSKMRELAKERHYDSPFWLTREEMEYFVFSNNRLQRLFNCNIPHSNGGLDNYKKIPSIEVENERKQKCHVMNLSEFAKITSSTFSFNSSLSSSSSNNNNNNMMMTNTTVSPEGRGLNHNTAFHMFRQFRPIDIRTKSLFPPDIADALRKYSMTTGCWCTVWGTPNDYTALDLKVPEGPLGVWVFDAEDSPLFLTPALTCDNPVKALTHVYKDDHIIFTQP
ncbi:uncharacterized protein TM35_000012790 [Trypanosoma theileri]|uniref:Trypanosoma Tc-38 (p38) protein domain-containing protein n=1 Tax=Trypanosoma theileri TaxID=67003 RepID=A0A1X0P8Z8_9TRYP|nr:uncharacterized protein TM35_000012790 [Trypanosoma theileri]ORC93402.1 hypothetical protein TM35_000012790 [Trypanosoma theileri]